MPVEWKRMKPVRKVKTAAETPKKKSPAADAKKPAKGKKV